MLSYLSAFAFLSINDVFACKDNEKLRVYRHELRNISVAPRFLFILNALARLLSLAGSSASTLSKEIFYSTDYWIIGDFLTPSLLCSLDIFRFHGDFYSKEFRSLGDLFLCKNSFSPMLLRQKTTSP
jgi:hypothetical protein